MVAALMEIKPDLVVEVPDCIAEVLDIFQDVMPTELPNVLPPRRNIDHRIELEPGARSPGRQVTSTRTILNGTFRIG